MAKERCAIEQPDHVQGKTPEWETPQDFFDKLNAEFSLELDICATAENKKCPMFFDKEMDGLSRSCGVRVVAG